ncbi:leukocyte immunoglobulin-like receptor subfamily B member 4 isoform X2 [Camelus ferus]|uniref:Leukocyte immunoglobulin-like receptor subfamily B member 4 isoform X2 n=1 Tax=Camelus ferus TaxID=419612 RepID=A0A8B8TN94_CAMFR|nr:leukocyte immunoglobulin-like receptor subfamily B member 4 isoform X2 [Camelus ferus]
MTGKPASLRTHPVGLRAEGTVSPPSAQPGPQGGGAMTPTLTALLCLGLSVGVRTQVQAGTLPKPTIWAEPGSVIPWGRPVTIWCQGTLGAQEFRLHKEGSLARWDTQRPLEPGDKATFSISYMTEHNTGRYRCYYHSLTSRSQDSDALVLRMSGWLRGIPSLSVQPGSMVASGQSVTLLCQSRISMDTFLLFKEGAAHPPLRLRSKFQGGQYRAEFSLSPVTAAHGGTYRCYSSLNTSPYLLSQPSDPLKLPVSGGAPGLRWYVNVPITGSVAFVVIVLLLLLLIRYLCQERRRKSDAAENDTQPAEGVQLDHQAAPSTCPQDVTHSTLRWETIAAPPSRSGEPPAEPTLYATLAIH